MNTNNSKKTGKGNLAKGLGYGLVTVSCWGALNISTHNALQNGFLPNDLTMLRYCVAGMICLPFVIINYRKIAKSSFWLRSTVFALLAGPLYGWLVNKGMQLTPLSYASVMVPTFTMVITMLLLSRMGEKVSKAQVIGTLVIVFGLYSLINSPSSSEPQSNIGVAAFLLAGVAWSSFTILLKRWKIELVSTIFMMNIVSGVIYFPVYITNVHSGLSSLPIEHWVTQIVVQSVVASIVVVFTFANAVKYLGATLASTLPALIPLVSISLAIVLFEQTITISELLALGVTSVGFVICTLNKHQKAIQTRRDLANQDST
ncbi:EamA/RhaT family transporter [Photobacterium ganghwense]|uniref:EamA domain-containing protein n=1 Tax=Photobacterium ganghwense TaxID=320778 RepID=A0A0J1H0A8_9GAMM|nr:DMT family transporter [Photobacterium ganghwense]KLV05263.1 hypothetical protein ABT57_21650 [Photobacterium ganghwense]PSU08005.1 EamA/RhaT family transporter [Photobacterium ganghwense]USN27165.1 EamA/RhaT family transporter [synthetic construct]